MPMPLVTPLGQPLFVVPRRNAYTLCTVEDSRLLELQALPVPAAKTPTANEGPRQKSLDQEAQMVRMVGGLAAQHFDITVDGWILWADYPEKLIRRAHTDAEPHEQDFAPLRLPEGYELCEFAVHAQALYVTTGEGHEPLLVFDLAEPEPMGWPVPVPFTAKGDWDLPQVQDLSIDGTRLFVVANWNQPLGYDLTRPLFPQPIPPWTLPPGWSASGLRDKNIGTDWLAQRSGTMHPGGMYDCIGLFDRRTLACYGILWTEDQSDWGGIGSSEPPGEVHYWHDLAWLDNVLLIAAGTDGVGVLDLRGIRRPVEQMPYIPEPRITTHPTPFRHWQRTDASEEFARECVGRIVYREVPGAAGRAVVRLLPLAGLNQVVAVLLSWDGYDSILMDVPLPNLNSN